MQAPQTISTAPAGTYALKEMPAGANPGIQRAETDAAINVTYENRFTLFDPEGQNQRAVLQQKTITTEKAVPQLGIMLVGLGGNNGSTFTSGILANKRQLSW